MLDTSSSSIYTISKSGYWVCWHGKTRSNNNKMSTSNSTCCQSTFCSYQGSSLWLDHTCMKVALILHPLGISVPYSGKKTWRKIIMRKELDVLNLLKKNTHTKNSLFLLSMPFATCIAEVFVQSAKISCLTRCYDGVECRDKFFGKISMRS